MVISKDTIWMLEIPREESEKAGNERDFEAWCSETCFQETDGEIKLNWFTQKLDTEYQVKCQMQGKNYKIRKLNNYAQE